MGSSRCFSLVGVYRGMLRFKALGLVLIIAPSFKLGIAHHFFHGFLTLPETFYQIFKIFYNRFDLLASGSTDWHPVQPIHRVSWCRTLIFGNYFDHISLFQTRNCVPLFLMDSSLFQEHSIKFSRFFCNRFDRLASGSAGSLSQLV